MLSGDIWQFNYPKPFGQPIPIFNPQAIKQIASLYNVEDLQLHMAAQGYSSNTLAANFDLSKSGSNGIHPAVAYQAALENWQSTIASSVCNPDGLPTDLLVFSLHAGTYLANTRTAVCLWIEENPEKADALLVDEQSRSGYLSSFFAVEPKTSELLVEFLGDQIEASHCAAQLLHELMITPHDQGFSCQNITSIRPQVLSEYIELMSGMK